MAHIRPNALNRFSSLGFLALGALPLGVLGCATDDGSKEGPGDGVFESADPSGTGSNGRDADLGGAPTAGGENADDGGDAERAIEEADIIKIEGNKLYALSQYGGLSVIDISQQDRLRLLGRHKIVAMPFEMYVRDGIVFALYQGFGEYVEDEEAGVTAWVQTGNIVSLDATTPSNIQELQRFAVPGSISDSRIVGDVMYVASFEDGYCWGCNTDNPRTAVVSLDVTSPSHIQKVDELSFDESNEEYSWKRSISVNDQRMYVAGPTWGNNGPVGSTIQVIDISDAGGDMKAGAEVEVAGQINSRWQMDEYDGVLRVVSQSPQWNLNVSPSVETFTVASASSVTPLGETTIDLPENEQLQSVRFDGPRGYAVTFQQTDPLFTIDLSDPANPAQVGELKMPGFLYHMEPRGDRMLALGFDQGNAEGSLTVSLFNVADLANPTMIDRVNFGGDWAYVAEDQDRIHKAFNILDDDGMILVPFAGWEYAGDQNLPDYWCNGQYHSGIQLIDWASDALTLRGVAPATSQARRGFLHDGRLFAMSDERLESFDISNKDEPVETASLALAQLVGRTIPADDNKLVRVGQNWWTNTTQLDVTLTDLAEIPVSFGQLDVSTLDDANTCYGSEWLGNIQPNGDQLYLMYETYDYDPNTQRSTSGTRIATVDVSDVTAPKLVANAQLDFTPSYSYGYTYQLVDHGERVVNAGSTMVVNQQEYQYDMQDGHVTDFKTSLKVVDLSEPSDPSVVNVAMPGGIGATGLVLSGNIVARSHYAGSPTNPNAVRFFLDRVNVANAESPVVLPPVNIPGSLLSYDAASEHAVTVDYRYEVQDGTTGKVCQEEYGYSANFTPQDPNNYDYERTPGRCTAVLFSLNLVAIHGDTASVLGTVELGPNESVGSVASGEDRLFVTLGQPYYYYGVEDGCFDCGYSYGWYTPVTENEQTVLTLGGTESGHFAAGRLEIAGGDFWGYAPIAASGKRAVLSSGWRGKLSVIDATNAAAPMLVRETEIPGYVEQLSAVNGVGIASMGYDGVKTISLDD